ncbi:MAG TPA: YCF48-related protein [Phycisphaerae bacterium]|nr:YCF48-related protein [Phycisphaerae bacterium]
MMLSRIEMMFRRLWALVLCVAVAGVAAGQATTQATGQRWTPVGLCGGGGLAHPAISPHDPGTIIMETDMGAKFRSHDGGRSWTSIHHAQIGSSFRSCPPVFHPKVPGKVYAITDFGGYQICVSTDNGQSWTHWPEQRLAQRKTIRRMSFDPDLPNRLIIGNAEGDVYLTDDDGKTWRQAKGIGGGSVLGIVTERSGPSDAPRGYYVGTTAGVFRSSDDGRTFEKIVAGLPVGAELRSFDGGSDGKQTVLYAVTSCELADGKLVGGVYVSVDKGTSWQRCMNPDINVQTKRFDQWGGGDLPNYTYIRANDVNPRRAYVYCRGTSYFPPNHSTIYRTDDAGASWSETFYVDPRFKQFNVEHDWMTHFRGTSWVGAPISMEISPSDPDVLIRADGMFAFLTTNGGKSWQACHAVPAGPIGDDNKLFWRNNGLVNTTTWHYYVDPHEPHRHYIAYTDIGFARSEDHGTTWRWWGPLPRDPNEEGGKETPVPPAWRNTCYELAFDPDVPGKMWGAFSGLHDVPNENSIWRTIGTTHQKGGICRTDDFGVHWQVAGSGLPDKPMLSIVLDPTSPKGSRTLYASVFEDGVYKSTDDGATWQRCEGQPGSDFNRRMCRLIRHRDGKLFAMVTGKRVRRDGPFSKDGAGLYRSDDEGKTWQHLHPSNVLLYPKDFDVDPADSNIIFIGACDAPDESGTVEQGGLYRTLDGGKTWKRVARYRPTYFGASFHPRRKGWVYATGCGWSRSFGDGGLWLSRDYGQTWEAFTQLPFASIHRVTVDPEDDSVIYVTSFGGSVWKGPAEPLSR